MYCSFVQFYQCEITSCQTDRSMGKGSDLQNTDDTNVIVQERVSKERSLVKRIEIWMLRSSRFTILSLFETIL